MDAKRQHPDEPSRKPLRTLGRDEMNLAEFPITLLTDRIPKDQTNAVYQDEIFDEKSGLTLSRKLTITAGNHGLTTPVDDEVILALIQLTREKNNFTNPRVEFTRHELVQMLNWSVGGAKYERIELSLDRWLSVYLKYENAWRDNRTKTWTTKGFHIIDQYELSDTRASDDQLDLLPSYIIWGKDIFASFQAGYLKPLDYDLCMGLRNSTAKRMYRFLDKRFHHKPEWTFELKELAHAHIGLGHHYEGPAHLKRNLMPAIAELETVGFLKPLPNDERFQKEGRDWKVKLVACMAAPATPSLETRNEQPDTSPLVAELMQRGVTKATAVELVQQQPAELIERQIAFFDWQMQKKREKIGEPGGYLVDAIKKDYAAPKGFISKAEQQQREQARQAEERQIAEERRRKRDEDARDQAERQAVNAYWQSLTKKQQADLEADAIAEATPEEAKMIEPGAMRRFGLALIRDKHIRRLLQAQPEPAVANA